MSCASSRAPSGTIQNPNTGKKPTTPPMINSSPAGIRAGRRTSQPAQETADSAGKSSGDPIELAFNPFGGTVGHCGARRMRF